MAKVLIHYSATDGPVGLWRGDEKYYLPTVDKRWQKRGENIVADKNPESTDDDFYDRLCSHSSYSDHFGTTESEDDTPLDAIMYKLRRESVQE